MKQPSQPSQAPPASMYRVMVVVYCIVAARIHAPGKRGTFCGKSYAGGNCARLAYSQGANRGLRFGCLGLQFTPFARLGGKSRYRQISTCTIQKCNSVRVVFAKFNLTWKNSKIVATALGARASRPHAPRARCPSSQGSFIILGG